MIESGYGQSSPFSRSTGAFSGNIRKALEEAVKDDAVKAIVLRVDSPGGSAEASDIILEATQRVKGHKPLIVSMGNVAASGGYYISCAADTIFADEMTITGSIGVVGGKLVTTGLWNKLGVNWVAQKRGANAGLMAGDHPFAGPQRARIEDLMQATYKQFKDHVTQGRGERLKKPIDEIAGGRVYTGKQALDLGLVDRIGGLNEALDFAAKRASIGNYEIKIIPEPKDFLTELVESLSGKETRPSDIEVTGGTQRIDFRSPLYQSALPLLSQLDPRRCAAFRQALGRLELIRREGVALMMPESLIIE
jgi:protease-4